MELFNERPPKATVKHKLFTGGVVKTDLVTIEKQNTTLSKIKTRPTSKYNSGTSQSSTSRSSSPSFIRRASITDASISMRAQSAERKRPNITSLKSSSAPSSPLRRPTLPSAERKRPNITSLKSSSAPSSPLRRPTLPSLPISKPSTPPSSVSSRPTTPVRDGIAEKQNPSRRGAGGRATDGLWPSMRSLSSSFQSESFVCVEKKDRQVRSTSVDQSHQTLKNTTKAVSERKRSPLTGRNTAEQSENSSLVQGAQSGVVDQHRWPAMKGGKVSTMSFSRSMNLNDRIEKAASLMFQSRGLSPTRRTPASVGFSKNTQKSSNRIVNVTSPHVEEKALSTTNPIRTLSLPTVALRRPSSPNVALMLSSSESRRTPSPISRPSSPLISSNNTMHQIGASSRVLSHISDRKKGIKGADMEDIHQLRLLYNRELQWRFVNSRAEVTLATQKIAAENICNNVWNVTSELQDSVTMEKINIEFLNQGMKLKMLLEEQTPYLEYWNALEGEHSTSLFGTIEVLEASMLRLPVNCGATVDVRAVKNAVSSAIDIMQAMGSSICSLLTRVESAKRLLCQLSAVAAKEKAMLDECRVLLAAISGMQMEECSLRAHMLQQFRQNMHILE